VVVSAGAANVASTRGPFLLISLPSIGQVTWRCDPSRHPGLAPGEPGLALGFHSSPEGQTGQLRLTSGTRTILTEVTQPGQVIGLPYLHDRLQRLDISQSGEDGTLRASVEIDFVPHPVVPYCFAYAPPKVNVQVLPRR
jgi:hypothetical protein